MREGLFRLIPRGLSESRSIRLSVNQDQGDGSTDPVSFYYLFVVSQYLMGMSEQVRVRRN